jgi:LmbE family N-acetylglucosaminyl deacetylase
MGSPVLLFELVGHSVVMMAFLAVAAYVVGGGRVLRRGVRRAALMSWLILAVGLLSMALNALHLVTILTRPQFAPSSVLDVAADCASMIGLSVVAVLLVGLRVVAERRDRRPWRILVIGAHLDDIEVACGGAIARLHDGAHVIDGLVMTHGQAGVDGGVRPAEPRAEASFPGLDSVRFLDFLDTRLSESSVPMTAAIEEEISRFRPDMIFSHSAHDLQQDHRAVHEATLRAARDQDTLFCYESPSVTPEFSPTLFIDVNDYLDVKIEVIREHWDRQPRPHMQPERVRGTAIFRGGQGKLRSAEAFEVIRANFSRIG